MPVKFASDSQDSTHPHAPASPAPSGAALCLKCNKAPITYKTDTCKHGLFCKDCAMKCATGGKCKVCQVFYGSFQKIE